MMSFRFSQKIRAQGPGASMDQAIGKCKGEKKGKERQRVQSALLAGFYWVGLVCF
jgi:hypothetical protein